MSSDEDTNEDILAFGIDPTRSSRPRRPAAEDIRKLEEKENANKEVSPAARGSQEFPFKRWVSRRESNWCFRRSRPSRSGGKSRGGGSDPCSALLLVM